MVTPSASSPPSREAIVAELAAILGCFGGRDYSGTIGPETRFFADLGLASIDAVVLGETLQSHYGRPIPFGELMADLGHRTDRDMTVGEMAEFLHRYFASVASATALPRGE
jgi:acyl carrier protein